MTSQLKTDLFADIFAAIQGGEKRIKINGLWGSSEAFFLSRLLHHGASFCLITPSFSDAQQMHQEVSFFTQMGNVQNAVSLPGLFPPSDILPDEQTQSRPDWMAARLSLLYPLAAGRPVSLVTSALALRQTVINKSFLLGQSEQFKVGDTVDRDLIIEHLHRNGYERIESVTQPGEFAVRGGIVDLYSPVQSGPVRIELSDDTIVSIRTFDPVSQKSIDSIDTIMVIPWRENHPAAAAMSLSDYLSPQTVLIYDEPDAVRLALENAPTRGGGLPAGEGVTIDLEALSIGSDRGAKRFTFDIPSLSSLGLERFGQSFSEVTQRLNQLRSDHFIIVVVRTQTQLERFQRLFNDYDIPFTQDMDHVPTGHNAAGSFTPREGAMPIFLTMGNISEGFLLPQSKMIFLTDELLSGHLGKRRSMTETKDPRSLLLSSLSDLKPYDFVVHIAHGIGRYLGLKRLSTSLGYGRETYETDCLMLQYAGGSNLYVPLESLKLVSKYIGSEGVHPPLDTLGGTRWARAKEKVKKTIQEMTGELLTLYAERKIVEGHSFRLTPHLDEFAAAFEYEETPDQLLAIEAIIDDMQGKKPMDRLICGDVGYGKTEVAMRGAFLAAMDNKQVAVVVPTTLLARQHGETFTKRFAPFPVSVAVLSRLSSRREQTKILSDLEKGAVDIVIATHRVFQKDVAFRDLGLVIVDEEHRFGVRHKEKLKQMRKKVDVLTLTATPIPRTLQIALAQTRDLTVIETAPANRLSIRTLLASFEPKLIREVIFRELVRGGQVFFVHNRVNDIGQIGVFLSDLIPEARICIAHGQMRPKMLEDIMMQFLAKKYNVLVTTTIIESGIDIPSANTIIINNADLFGLAELYQLRGRVGRSNEQAYAY
jgi:transcription-repair coupling factor (superfamily II helicase)